MRRSPAGDRWVPPEDLVADFTSFDEALTRALHRHIGMLDVPGRAEAAAMVDRGSKRLRPTLVFLAALLGSPERDRMIDAATVVELLHLASLLHDDVIDDAATRRGHPSAHVRIGREAAVLLGVGCFATAAKLAADLGNRVNRAVCAGVVDLAYGEVLDVERAYQVDLSADDYLAVVRRKTGTLFAMPCVVGGIIGGVSQTALGALSRYGEYLGTAFQIFDDCLDLLVGNSDKPMGTDHARGLFGFPTLHVLRDRRTQGNDDLTHLLTALEPATGHTNDIAELVTLGGGFRQARTVIHELVASSLHELDGLPSGPARAGLRALAESIAKRAVSVTGAAT